MTTHSELAMPYVLDWPQWSDYQVGPDGWIYVAGEPRDVRQLTNTVDLVNPFARLAVRPRQEQVQWLLAFVQQFGLLGQTVLSGKTRMWDGAPPIRLPPNLKRETTHFDGARAPRMADNIDWALLHARNVDLIMRLHHTRWKSLVELDQLLRQLDARTLRVRGIPATTKSEESWEVQRHPVTLRVPLLAEPWQLRLRDGARHERGHDPVGVSRRLIDQLLEPNLGGVSRGSKAGTPIFRFQALVQLLYWQLADRLDHYAIRQCRCGALFFADHGRQRSCSDECFMKLYMRDYRKGVRRRKTKRTSKKGRTS